jgi:glucokinase
MELKNNPKLQMIIAFVAYSIFSLMLGSFSGDLAVDMGYFIGGIGIPLAVSAFTMKKEDKGKFFGTYTSWRNIFIGGIALRLLFFFGEHA